MPVQVEKKEIITVKDDRGVVLTKGDPILLRIQDEDIVCRYVGILNGYFVTETLGDAKENKYRQSSIGSVVRIAGIKSYSDPEAECVREKED